MTDNKNYNEDNIQEEVRETKMKAMRKENELLQ